MDFSRDAVLKMEAGPALDGWVDERLFGIDRTANTPERIREAIQSAMPVGTIWPGDDYDYLIEVDGVRHKLLLDRNHHDYRHGYKATWMWEQRHGKPWQAVLEALVAAWRAPPSRPWSADTPEGWAAMRELVERLGLSIVRSEDGYYAIRASDVEHGFIRGTDVPKVSLIGREGEQWHPAPTAPHAVALAAVLCTLE